MKVLHFSGYVDPEGRRPAELMQAWPTLVDVAIAAARSGADVQVIQAARHDEVIHRDGVRFRFVREPRYPAWRKLFGHRAAPHPWRTLQAAATTKVDVIHLQGLSFPLQARALTTGATPVLAQDHADRVPVGWRRPLHSWGLGRIAGAAFADRELADPFVARGVLPQGLPVFEVLEGSSRFKPVPDARERIAMHGDPAVLWVGHLVKGKDPLTVLEAIREMMGTRPKTHLWMIFQKTTLLEELRAWLGLHPTVAERVHLLGEVPHDRMPDYLSAADLLVTASHREGSGYAVIETMACGTPVVVSDIAPLRGLVRGLACARTARVGDPSAFASALTGVAKLVSDRGTDVMRSEVRRHFESTLSFDVIGAQLTVAYESLLRGQARVHA